MTKEVVPGSYVKLSYQVLLKRDGTVIESTKVKTKEGDKTVEKDIPIVVKVGTKALFFEDELIGNKEGEEKEVVLPPEKAYGKRDPKKVETVPLKLLRKALGGRSVKPGDIIYDENGRYIGKVVYVGSRDVLIDRNPPYAGEEIIVRFKIHKVVLPTDPPEEIAKAILERHLRDLAEKVKVEVSGGVVRYTTKLGEMRFSDYVSRYSAAKPFIAAEVVEATDLDTVEFVDTYSLVAPSSTGETTSIKAEAPVEALAEAKAEETKEGAGGEEGKTEEK